MAFLKTFYFQLFKNKFTIIVQQTWFMLHSLHHLQVFAFFWVLVDEDILVHVFQQLPLLRPIKTKWNGNQFIVQSKKIFQKCFSQWPFLATIVNHKIIKVLTSSLSRWYSSMTYWYFGVVIPKKYANFSPQNSAAIKSKKSLILSTSFNYLDIW